MAPSALPAAVPMLASSMSDPSVNVSAKITDVKRLGVVLRDGDIVAYTAARGSIALAQK
jgi:hypothetical protein